MDRLTIKRAQVRWAIDHLGAGWGIEMLRVGQVMTPAPTCISASASALDLVRMFHDKEFRHLLITDNRGRLTGVVSDRDVLRCFGPDRAPRREVLASIPASQIMSSDVITIGPEANLPTAVKRLTEHGISCLPVTAGDVLVGIITNTDLHVVLESLLESRPVESSASAV
jgi:CBS-domain-containing membrane protein